jgi:DNA-binding transcriptional regulator YiaG
MSKKSSFREQLDRAENTAENARTRSGFPAVRLILAPERIEQPVDIARILVANGVSLRKAHDTINRLAAGNTVALEVPTSDKDRIASDLGNAGVNTAFIEYPHADIKRIRENLGYSQAEFAMRYAIEIDTLQNWEQGRNKPDQALQLMFKMIETSPELAEKAITSQSFTDSGKVPGE